VTTPGATIDSAESLARSPTLGARELDYLVSLSSDLECGGCGYQIATYSSPPECPMCRERNWQPIATQSKPF
jgi:rubrerythrin